jgi:hypothetical protein
MTPYLTISHPLTVAHRQLIFLPLIFKSPHLQIFKLLYIFGT